jgi:lysine-ketoglutarate reductase/saccharopine dehydrogenase-like protein (TIGR00300 family)
MYIQEAFELHGHTPTLTELEDLAAREDAHLELHGTKPLRFSIFVSPERLEHVSALLVKQGCKRVHSTELKTEPAPKDGVVPDDFHSTSNNPTFIFRNGKWIPVQKLRMDGVITFDENGTPFCNLMRNVRAGEEVVVGHGGIRIAFLDLPAHREAEFGFMQGEVSSERQNPVLIRKIAREMKKIRDRGGRIIFVAGPGVIHTGGMTAFCGLIEKGYVSAVLSGNALATHDIENALYSTSLGVNTKTAEVVAGGHRHHLSAINRIRFHGSIANAVRAGELRSGIMYTLVKHNVPFVLAGSIRDDGPLPDTEMDLVKAQERYWELVQGTDMVIIISTMLHAIGTANMIPATCKTICVDINPAVVSKLADRGSTQTVGIVTDAGLFVEELNRELDILEGR